MLAALDEYAFKAFETLKGRISRFNNTRNDFACGCLHSAAALNAVPLSTISGLAQDCSIQHQNKCGICPWPKMSEHAGFQFIFINIQESKSVQIKFLSMVKTISVHFIPIFHTKTCPNSTFTVSSCTARNLGRSMLRCIECAFKALEVLTGSILRLHSSRTVCYTQLSSVCCGCQCP